MESPGKYLKAERESQNLSLKEVSESTKVPERLLKAIEEDQYKLISSPVYVKGFLDAYARCLGLDSSDILARYEKYKENETLSKGQELKQRRSSSSVNQRISFSSSSQWIPFFLKERRRLLFFVISAFVIILFTWMFTHRSSLKHPNQPVASSEKEQSGSTFLTSPSSPSPVPREVETQTTNPPSEKSQTPQSMGTNVSNDIPSESPEFEVIEAGVGTAVERRDDFLILKGKKSEFLCNNQKVYFVTKIKGSKESKVVHVWSLNGKEFQKRELKIRPTEWTVYSLLTLRPGDAGNWRVEVRYNNNVLTSLSFKAIELGYHSAHRRQ